MWDFNKNPFAEGGTITFVPWNPGTGEIMKMLAEIELRRWYNLVVSNQKCNLNKK